MACQAAQEGKVGLEPSHEHLAALRQGAEKNPRQSASHPTLIRILHSCVDAKCDHFNLVKHLRE